MGTHCLRTHSLVDVVRGMHNLSRRSAFAARGCTSFAPDLVNRFSFSDDRATITMKNIREPASIRSPSCSILALVDTDSPRMGKFYLAFHVKEDRIKLMRT